MTANSLRCSGRRAPNAVAPPHWDDRLERFEEALAAGAAPELAPCLAGSDDSRGSLLVELVRCYQSRRALAGSDAATCLSELIAANPRLRPEIYEAYGELSTQLVRGPSSNGEVTRVTPEGFGPYSLVHPLGAGGFGQVDLAYHPHDMQLAVLKRVPPPAVDGGVRVRVLREEHKTLLRLRGVEGVPRCIQWVENERGEAALALEYVAGQSLQGYLTTSAPSQEQVVIWLCQLAQTLQEVHDQKVFHCDLKPANVLLEADTGRARLIDFGLSVASPRGDWRPLRPAPSAGTWSYAAPEIAATPTPAASKVDVFGLGGLLYCLLTGEAPFQARDGRSAMDRALTYDVDWKLLEAAPCDPLLKSVCRRALAKDPAERHRCPREIAELLRPLNPLPAAERPSTPVSPALRRLHAMVPAGAALIGAVCLAVATLGVGGGTIPADAALAIQPSEKSDISPPPAPLINVEDLSYAVADADTDRLGKMQPPGAPVEPLASALQRTPANSTGPAYLSFVDRSRDNPEAAYWLAGQLRAGLDPNLRLSTIGGNELRRVRSDLLQVAIAARNSRIAEILLAGKADPRPVFDNLPDTSDTCVHHFLFPGSSLQSLTAFDSRLQPLIAARLHQLGVRDCPVLEHPAGHPLHRVMKVAKGVRETFDVASDLNLPSDFTADRLRLAGWTVPDDLPHRFAWSADATPGSHLQSTFVKYGTREPYRTYPFKGLSSWEGSTCLQELSFLRVLQADRREAWVAVIATYPAGPEKGQPLGRELLLGRVTSDFASVTLYASRKPEQLNSVLGLLTRSFLPADHDGSIAALAPELLPTNPWGGTQIFEPTLPSAQQDAYWRQLLSSLSGGSWKFEPVARTPSPWVWCTPLATDSFSQPSKDAHASAFNGRLMLRYSAEARRLEGDAATFIAIE